MSKNFEENWIGETPIPDPGAYQQRFPAKADYWSEVDAFTVYSATLLMFGIDPTKFQEEGELLRSVEETIPCSDLPIGYLDRLNIIKTAVDSGALAIFDLHKNEVGETDYYRTYIHRKTLIKWCDNKSYDLPIAVFPEISKTKITDSLSTKERESMLKIIIGMAVGRYSYDPKKERNDATGENNKSISADLAKAGIIVDNGTIKKYIDEAKGFLPKK